MRALTSKTDWWNSYIGIPFRDHGWDLHADGGLNCMALVRWVFWLERGILLPSYADDVDGAAPLASQLETLNTSFLDGAEAWAEVAPGQHQPFDVVLMRRGHLACHVGIVTKPREGRMLHIESGISSCLEDYAAGFWARRVVGVYRHA